MQIARICGVEKCEKWAEEGTTIFKISRIEIVYAKFLFSSPYMLQICEKYLSKLSTQFCKSAWNLSIFAWFRNFQTNF